MRDVPPVEPLGEDANHAIDRADDIVVVLWIFATEVFERQDLRDQLCFKLGEGTRVVRLGN